MTLRTKPSRFSACNIDKLGMGLGTLLCYHYCVTIRDGEGAEQNHTQVIEHELSSVELLIKQRSEVQKLRAEEAKALTDEDYELAEQLSKKLEQIDLVSEWNIAETGLNAVS